ncbi:CbiX/SirB N-terminal domain-containing protein [Cutibacterium granulosum]|uniref:CbiX/SirB N-terminal domain-containing protein n=1 Tax=Cutibacterium granulosum TaxID=33011 RepID=UPI0027B9DCBF|nr:CbiX/SirB N-terminal domain-containing protein [Cutibacterium granulosum]
MTDTKIASGTPLVIAAHGTRDESGVAECRALAERVANKLPDVPVELGFVELAEPKIPEAVQAAVAQAPVVSEGTTEGEQPVAAVVVPLMFNTGGHVREDIPEAIDEGRGDARVAYSAPLLPDVRMRRALDRRLAETLAAGEGREQWRARDTAVVLVGRGALVADANASHYTLTRMFWEENDLARVEPAFIQVTRPSVPEALTALHAQGAQQIVVQGNFLFPGLLHVWMTEQVQAWQASHPGVEIRIAPVIGDCDEVAEVVVDRYREPLDEVGLGEGAPVYMSGLRLQGRTVLVVGAGHVAERRVARLLDAGADVHVVAPNSGIQLTRMARKGLVNLERRAFQNDDLDGVWFVQALTNDPQVNAKVTAEAEKRGIFCVRGDDGRKGSAFTPATQQAGGMTVSVVGDRTPRRSAKIRDEVLRALQG